MYHDDNERFMQRMQWAVEELDLADLQGSVEAHLAAHFASFLQEPHGPGADYMLHLSYSLKAPRSGNKRRHAVAACAAALARQYVLHGCDLQAVLEANTFVQQERAAAKKRFEDARMRRWQSSIHA